MFGPGVGEAIATIRNIPNDMDLAGLLALFGSTDLMVPRWKRTGETVIGMDENNNEIIRVPLKEPAHILKAFDAAQGVARTNIS
jgi:hypothetical protein